MKAALSASGWRNYSLFLAPDGLLVGYVESDDFDRARQTMEATDVNRRWQESVADLFELPAGAQADTGMQLFEEVFHLD